jgi:hypothetical protein
VADYPIVEDPPDVDVAPTTTERTERVLAEAWQTFHTSPIAGDPFAHQAAALRAAGLLKED